MHTIEQSLQQAVAQHQSGELQEAEKRYRAILKAEPHHPKANHNLGALYVQMQQPVAGLPFFIAALEADPAHGQYWLSYIDALHQAGQLEDARQVLALARQSGLQGEEVESLVLRLEAGSNTPWQAEETHQDTAERLPGVSVDSRIKTTSQKSISIKPNKSASKSALYKEKEPSKQESDTLVSLFNQGRFAEAATLAQTMTLRFPQHWLGWKMLGVVFNQMGRDADALIPMQRAVALLPNDPESHNNLGITLLHAGRLKEAEASYRRAIQLNPDYAQAYGNLGATLQESGRLKEAVASYRRATQIEPGYAKAHSNLGSVLHDMGRLAEAEDCYRRAIQLKPDYIDVHNNLGITLHDMGRLAEAEECYRRALVIDPDCADVHFNLGNVLLKMGRLDEAEACCRRALQLKPDYAEAHSNLGVILHDMGRLGEAEASSRRALQLKPDYAKAHNNLGRTLNALERQDEAETSYRHALQLKPDLAETHSNLGSLLHDLGRLSEAEASFRRALEIKPDFDKAHSNLLFCISQNATMDAQALFAEHCRFGELFEGPFRAGVPEHGNSRDVDRTLRVGFVSGDLRNHAVASFIEPLLANLSHDPKLSLHIYANHSSDDSTTMRLREHCASWHPSNTLSDEALAEKIRADGIDILIDLSGHTAKNRLLAFARKPAPLQASWMGYPCTTGMSAMDYYFSDRYLLPHGIFDSQFTEKIVRLPASAPFLPNKDAPPVSPLPALGNGYVTFGSFNRLSKLSREVVALWGRLLRTLPDSRLVLGGMPKEGTYGTLIEWFVQESVARERLDFHPRSDMEQYLRLHQQVDICLDTFPYNGGTTTLHALWMGVPTITLAGGTAAGRSGAAILGHVGLESFVAHDAGEFVEKGLYWASNLAELSAIRAGLREHVFKSAIGQPEVIAAGLSRALRIMWQRWCLGESVVSFEVTREMAEAAREAGK